MLRILTDRGSQYRGNLEHHEFALDLDWDNIKHTRTKTRSAQTNGICERFPQTIQNEFYVVPFRLKVYPRLEQLQADVDDWIDTYHHDRTHSGTHCLGKAPWQSLLDSQPLALAKQLDRTLPTPLRRLRSLSQIKLWLGNSMSICAAFNLERLSLTSKLSPFASFPMLLINASQPAYPQLQHLPAVAA